VSYPGTEVAKRLYGRRGQEARVQRLVRWAIFRGSRPIAIETMAVEVSVAIPTRSAIRLSGNSVGSKSCDSCNREQQNAGDCEDSQHFQIVWRSRSTQRHIGRHQCCLSVVSRIVMHDDWRSLRVLGCPLFERPNLIGWVLPNRGRRNIARIDVRRNLLRAYRVAQAAMDVVLFPPTTARLI